MKIIKKQAVIIRHLYGWVLFSMIDTSLFFCIIAQTGTALQVRIDYAGVMSILIWKIAKILFGKTFEQFFALVHNMILVPV